MSGPFVLEGVSDSLGEILISERFSVEQGAKIRPIDNASKSGLNFLFSAIEKLRWDSLDELLECLRWLSKICSVPLGLWKLVIDSAYRRIPIDPSQKHLAWTAFKHKIKPKCC